MILSTKRIIITTALIRGQIICHLWYICRVVEIQMHFPMRKNEVTLG